MEKKEKEKIAVEAANILLKIGAVTLNPKKPFRYASGILSPVYTDCRILISYPEERKKIVDLLLKLIESTEERFDIVAATATAGIPHGAWVAEKLNLPMIYVRGKPKDHGKNNQIEGILKKNQKAAIIEDLISTGESSSETAKAIRSVGGEANYIFSIMTYNLAKSQEIFKTNKIKLVPLTTFQTIVENAQLTNYLTNKEKEIILDWIKDPSSWANKWGLNN